MTDIIPLTSIQAVDLKAKLFRGLADPSRLRVLESLRDGERSVSAIIEATGLSQSNVSNHLNCLHDCGLVARQQQGRFVYYRLSDPRVATLMTLAESLIADVAHGLYACTRYASPEESQ